MDMSAKRTVRYSRDRLPKGKTNWARIRSVTDTEIDRPAVSDPEAPPTNREFWRDAHSLMPPAASKSKV